jgi:hypothetical protein
MNTMTDGTIISEKGKWYFFNNQIKIGPFNSKKQSELHRNVHPAWLITNKNTKVVCEGKI